MVLSTKGAALALALLCATANGFSLGPALRVAGAGVAARASVGAAWRSRDASGAARERSSSSALRMAYGVTAEAGARTAAEDVPDAGRPLRVAIAGGGVGGLTAALCMLKAGFDVTVYEKTGQFARFGGPIQVTSGEYPRSAQAPQRSVHRIARSLCVCGAVDARQKAEHHIIARLRGQNDPPYAAS
jgi:hypothetical protein